MTTEDIQEIRRTLQNLLPGSRYSTRVRALNEFGQYSDWSEALEFVAEASASSGYTLVAPPAPSILPLINAVGVIMDYVGPNDGISRYRIEHSTDNLSFNTLATTQIPLYIHQVSPGTTHYYRFTITDVYGTESPLSPSNSGQSVSALSHKPYSTILVAASDSIAAGAGNADYICDGVDDQITINAALDAAYDVDTQVRGQVLLLEGNYYCTDQVHVPQGVTLRGMGAGSHESYGSVLSFNHATWEGSVTVWDEYYPADSNSAAVRVDGEAMLTCLSVRVWNDHELSLTKIDTAVYCQGNATNVAVDPEDCNFGFALTTGFDSIADRIHVDSDSNKYDIFLGSGADKVISNCIFSESGVMFVGEGGNNLVSNVHGGDLHLYGGGVHKIHNCHLDGLFSVPGRANQMGGDFIVSGCFFEDHSSIVGFGEAILVGNYWDASLHIDGGNDGDFAPMIASNRIAQDMTIGANVDGAKFLGNTVMGEFRDHGTNTIFDGNMGTNYVSGTFNLPRTTLKLQELLDVNETGIAAGKLLRFNGAEWEMIDETALDDDHYEHTQGSANTTWTITHNLGKFPSVVTVDTGGTVINGTVTYNSNMQATVVFSTAVDGKAYCN